LRNVWFVWLCDVGNFNFYASTLVCSSYCIWSSFDFCDNKT